ncbi:uncharacterized protein LOC100907189 [Galendromus occidentalis]|uniref:Uncharacterized protein LOC100907189 n=1 Tax=Galendromus occidentalis TaxID=34638 RepID=A0AAJ6QY11_9ACAR|nr:uncharacterized protein LOC100907189 [Galendromus occidentalis]
MVPSVPSNSSETMYLVSSKLPDGDPRIVGKLSGLLITAPGPQGARVSQNPALRLGPEGQSAAEDTFPRINGEARKGEGAPQGITNARDIEMQLKEYMTAHAKSAQDLSSHVAQNDREIRKAAWARFLKPALLKAQADRRNEPAKQSASRTQAEDLIRNASPTRPGLDVPVLSNGQVDQEVKGIPGGSAHDDSCAPPISSRVVPRTPHSIPSMPSEVPKPLKVAPPPQTARSPVKVTPPPQTARSPVKVAPLPAMTGSNARTTSDGASGNQSKEYDFMRAIRTLNNRNIMPPGQECIRKKRRYAIGEWKSFLVTNFCPHHEAQDSFVVWISESEVDPELQKQLKLIDPRFVVPLESPMLGGAALINHGGKYRRVTIKETRYREATVQDVDTGDEIEVSSADLCSLPLVLKSIPPLALKVVVESGRITNAKRFESALRLAKEHRTITDGCAVTWDFVPKFVFRLPGCRALGVSKNLISLPWNKGVRSDPLSEQKLYDDLPAARLPRAGSLVRNCFVTHVEGSSVYLTWEALHNYEYQPQAEDIPLEFEVGKLCKLLWQTEPWTEMRGCIEVVEDDVVSIRWIDCGSVVDVSKECLHAMSAADVYSPLTVKAKLANFNAEELEYADSDLSQVLSSMKNLHIFVLDSNPVPAVLIFTEDFTEVKLENLEGLKALSQEGDPIAPMEPEAEAHVEEVTVVGIAAFAQIWVVPKEKVRELEEMEARLTRANPPPLVNCSRDTACSVMLDGLLRRASLRLRAGRRFLLRLLDRASEISAYEVFELPEEFRDLPSPSYRIALCPEQVKEAHFGRFIAALKRNPEVTLKRIPVESATVNGTESSSSPEVPSCFIQTTCGQDIISAYDLRDEPL